MPGESAVHLTQFPILLKIHPQARRGAEGFGEQHGHRRGNAASASADLVDPCHIRAQMSGEVRLGDAALSEHLLKDVSGVDGDGKVGWVFGHKHILSVVVGDLDVLGVAGPAKTDAILVVDADRVLPLALAVQRMEVQSWPDTKVVERLHRRQKGKPAPGKIMQLNREGSPGALGVETGGQIACASVAIAANRHFGTLAHSANGGKGRRREGTRRGVEGEFCAASGGVCADEWVDQVQPDLAKKCDGNRGGHDNSRL